MNIKKILIVFLSSTSILCYAKEILKSLDELAINCDTDKSSKWHNYAIVYDEYFNKLRNKKINFLEIGFYKGSSAKMWDLYFSKANLYFIDIERLAFEAYGKNLSNKCTLKLVDQGNEQELLNFTKEVSCEFDVILDDGGHTMEQQITSFKTLFPFVKKGGIYIIEDLHTSYWKEYGAYGTLKNPKSGPGTAVRFLQNLIDDINFGGARTLCADPNKYKETLAQELTMYQKEVSHIVFYPSICFIFKA